MLYILAAIGGFILGFITFAFLIIVLLTDTFQTMERNLLISAAELTQYKHHAIKVLELAYEKAGEEDKNKAEEFQLVAKKINEKFDSYGESWIKLLMTRLPYKTEYNDWKTSLAFVERLLIINKLKK